MIKTFLKRRRSAETGNADAEAGYGILSASLPGRSIIAFEKAGRAAALEVTERGAEILQGLAAGAILSELEDVREDERFGMVQPFNRHDGASRREAEDFIHSLDLLDWQEKKALLGALPR
jgi:hypothetical protein